MADANIKDFTVDWVLFGLLFFCLLTFAISFMFYNNPEGLGDSSDIFENTAIGLQGNLVELPDGTDSLLNITAETRPEASYLGSRDSVATSYGLTGTSRGFFQSTKIFMGWILTGTSGKLLLGVFSGLFGLVALYFIIKLIRSGT